LVAKYVEFIHSFNNLTALKLTYKAGIFTKHTLFFFLKLTYKAGILKNALYFSF
jgi:hypothetical protein